MIDIECIKSELQVLPEFEFQICLQGTSTNNDPFCSIGISDSLTQEKEVTVWLFDNMPYTKKVCEGLKMFRTRIMRMPSKYCYSFHQDYSPRLHIPIITNTKCFFLLGTDNPNITGDEEIKTYPADGNYYYIDTTKYHTAVNASFEDRIHIVGCIDG
jgi:hypothetical protein